MLSSQLHFFFTANNTKKRRMHCGKREEKRNTKAAQSFIYTQIPCWHLQIHTNEKFSVVSSNYCYFLGSGKYDKQLHSCHNHFCLYKLNAKHACYFIQHSDWGVTQVETWSEELSHFAVTSISVETNRMICIQQKLRGIHRVMWCSSMTSLAELYLPRETVACSWAAPATLPHLHRTERQEKPPPCKC